MKNHTKILMAIFLLIGIYAGAYLLLSLESIHEKGITSENTQEVSINKIGLFTNGVVSSNNTSIIFAYNAIFIPV